jgi:hypothetical protein
MVEDISPLNNLEHALYYWWAITLAMIIGGLAGWGISRFSTPVYEARAGYRVTLDGDSLLEELRKTDPDVELTYDIRAPYLTPVALAFYTPEVRSAVEEQARAEGLDFPPDGFRNGQLTLDQRRSDWTVIVRHADSETAATLANLWVAIADAYLKRAQEQSALAASLKLQITLLSNCFTKTSLADANQCAGTSFVDTSEMQAYYQNLDRRYQDAFSASDGVSTLVSFDPGVIAVPPVRPIYYSTGLLIVAGCLLGLIFGGVIVQRLPLKNS